MTLSARLNLTIPQAKAIAAGSTVTTFKPSLTMQENRFQTCLSKDYSKTNFKKSTLPKWFWSLE
jgi:hypothetical protein